jgi:hypothetical protein
MEDSPQSFALTSRYAICLLATITKLKFLPFSLLLPSDAAS